MIFRRLYESSFLAVHDFMQEGGTAFLNDATSGRRLRCEWYEDNNCQEFHDGYYYFYNYILCMLLVGHCERILGVCIFDFPSQAESSRSSLIDESRLAPSAK